MLQRAAYFGSIQNIDACFNVVSTAVFRRKKIILHSVVHKFTNDQSISVFCPGFQKGRVPSEKGTFSAVNGPSKGHN